MCNDLSLLYREISLRGEDTLIFGYKNRQGELERKFWKRASAHGHDLKLTSTTGMSGLPRGSLVWALKGFPLPGPGHLNDCPHSLGF